MTTTLSPEVINVEQLPSAQSVESAFVEYSAKVSALKATAETLVVSDETDSRGMKLARETRLALKDIRCAIEAKRKQLKEESLRRGQRVDAAAREMTALIEPLETRMLEQEQFAVRAAAERQSKLREERQRALAQYLTSDAWMGDDLGVMSEDRFAVLLADYQAIYKQRREREQKEREEAEAQIRAEAEAREKLRLENERLRAEAAQRDAVARVVRERVEAEARATQEAHRKEREKAEAERRAEREAAEAAQKHAAEQARKEREIAAEVARKEREAREKAEAELRAKKLAEEVTRKAEAAAARKAAKAPDKAKLEAFAASVAGIPRPTLGDESYTESLRVILHDCCTDILNLAESL